MRGAPARLVAIVLAALVISCGGAPRKPVVEAPVEPPRPRNAAAIAQAIVMGGVMGGVPGGVMGGVPGGSAAESAGGNVSVMLYAERTRGHPITARLAALDLWTSLLAGTGLDPERDLVRAFVTAPHADAGWAAVAVLEHKVPPDKLELAMAAMMARSDPPGTAVDGLGVPAVRMTVRGHTRVVARVEPSFLVVLPEAKAREAKRFVGTGGFPDPTGDEAAVAVALDPARTLRAPRVPQVPPTVRSLEAKVTLSADGGAVVALDGVSSSPEQAALDAAALGEAVDAATTVRIAIVKIRVFDPIRFFAEGDRVKAKRRVTPEELDKLFGLLSAVLPR
jgi:hypothetical protein